MLKYEDLTVHQRIAIKGMIASEGKGYALSHRYKFPELRALKALWMLSDFKKAVNVFLSIYTTP